MKLSSTQEFNVSLEYTKLSSEQIVTSQTTLFAKYSAHFLLGTQRIVSYFILYSKFTTTIDFISFEDKAFIAFWLSDIISYVNPSIFSSNILMAYISAWEIEGYFFINSAS